MNGSKVLALKSGWTDLIRKFIAARPALSPTLTVAREHRSVPASDDLLAPPEPTALSLEGMSPILVLAPHQDDEVIGAGGTLLLARQAGAEICVSFTTDGGIKPTSLGTKVFGSVENYLALRKAEALKVCRELGAEMHELGVSNARPQPNMDDLDRLGELVHRIAPKVIMVPWLLDAAPKHRMTNHLLWLANHRRALPDCTVWAYQINNTPRPNGFVDFSEVVEGKRKLIDIYQSQNNYLRRYDHQTIGLNAWNSRYIKNKNAAAKAYFVEVFTTSSLSEHLDSIERTYFADLNKTYHERKSLVEAMMTLHRRVLAAQ